MASLLIRNFDDALHAKLKARARAHHRSLEEEARETLRDAVASDDAAPAMENLASLAARLFGDAGDYELDLPSRNADVGRLPPDFSGADYGA
jgi:plasmid stability protein